MNTRRVRDIVALISVAFATLAGCAPTPAPTSPTPTPTQATPTPQEYELEVFWASNQPTDIRLASETVTISTTTTPLVVVLSQIVDGTLQPADPDYVNLWGSGSQLTSLAIDGSRATIDVAEPKLNVGAIGEFRALQQLMFTVAAAEPDVTEFSFLVNGQTVETLAGHIDLTTPLTTGDPNEALLAVQIDSPVENAAASNPVTVRGEACVFEANVAWELTQGASTIDSGSTMAAEACPTRSEWTLELGELEPGDYVIVVREISAKDGSVVTEDSTRFTVQ